MKTINTSKAPAAIGPYSQAIQVGNFLYLSGQIPVNPKTGEIVIGNIVEQAEQVIENIGAILREVKVSFSSVVKTTCYLKNMEDFSDFNTVYAKYFVNKPARSCVAVRDLPKGSLCEIEVLVVID